MKVQTSGCVIFVEAVSELVLAQIFPDVFGGVQLRRVGRQDDGRNVFWHDKVLAVMPARAVEEERGMCAGRDGFGDLLEVFVHGLGVGVGHDDPGAYAAVRADGAEQVGPFIARIAHGRGLVTFRAQSLVSVPFCPTRASS